MKVGIPIGLIVIGSIISFNAYEAIQVDKRVRGIQATYGSDVTGSLSGSEGIFLIGGGFLVILGLILLLMNINRRKS